MLVGNHKNNMTAMSTAKSGYIQRKIVKVCEDIQIQYDQTVRDATGKIYQFAYGEDNFDPTKTIRVGGNPESCDILRMAERLNTSFELGIEDKHDDIQPNISSSIINEIQTIVQNTSKISPEKQKLIDKIRKNNPSTIVDEDWTVNELRQRLQALDVKEDEDDEHSEEDNSELLDEEYDDNITTIEDEDENDDEENVEEDDDEEVEDDIEDETIDVDDGDFDTTEF
jgi:hypothetical protein